MPATSRRRVGNLPMELTNFVGRRREVAEAKHILSAARLLTLTGTGGVGKTRMALRVASSVYRQFPDGVWLVELADLRDPRLLPSTVAAALGLHSNSHPADRLTEYIVDKQMLLVLDNCEHLTAECAVLVAKLLTASGGVRILATSRHTLHLEGEHILQVEPLAVPSVQDVGAGPSEAVTLFAERAASVLPGFELTPDNRSAVVRICQRLEGIPLAIELAAVRMRVLSVHQLLQRLDNRFSLLTTRSYTVQTRQLALEATIDWSFELCSPAEQRLWAQLSVFPGGFDLDAVEHVCLSDVDDLLDVMTGLVDKSILIRQNGAFPQHTWYRMLETLREYGSAKLSATGNERDVRARQVEHYTNLARQYRVEGFGPHQLEWVGRLRREHANLRAVLEHCLSTPERTSDALDIASALWNYWYAGGFVLEGYQYLRRGLDLCDQRTAVRAEALYAASFLAIHIGDPAAENFLAELAELAEQFDDERLRAGHMECAGQAVFFAGDLTDGADLLERALAGYRATGDTLLVFDTLILLAAVRFFLGDPQGAVNANEALGLTERHQARWSRGYALWAVAIHEWRAGQYDRAIGLLHEAIALRLTDRTLLAFLLEALAWCQSSAGVHDRAARLLGSAQAVWRLSGARIDEMSPYQSFDEQCGALSRVALGDQAYNAAFAEGVGSGLDQVIKYALKEKPTVAARGQKAINSGSLTKRQQEIAELVARGMSNKGIAEALVIGRRTVESHVENILATLGVNSRAQIASWLAGRTP